MELAPIQASRRGGTVPLLLVAHSGPVRALERGGFRVTTFDNATSLFAALTRTLPDVVFLDASDRSMPPLDLVHAIRSRHATVHIVPLLMPTQQASASELIRAGAYDTLPHGCPTTQLVTMARNAGDSHRLLTQVSALERTTHAEPFPGLVGQSPRMRELFSRMSAAAPSDASVLLSGERGTEAGPLARAVHEASARAAGPFVAVDCVNLRTPQQAAELFGRAGDESWASVPPHPGRIEAADGGTLYLDEVASLSLDVQAQLVRVLDSQTVTRVGGQHPQPVTCRIIASTHRNLDTMVTRGEFLGTLYQRLAVVHASIPALRERSGDLDRLLEHMLHTVAAPGAPAPRVDDCARAAMQAYHWPGNTRELRSVLERATQDSSDGCIHIDDLPPPLRSHAVETPANDAPPPLANAAGNSNTGTLADLERAAIERELARCKGNVTAVGKALGIGRTTLYRRLKLYGLR